MYSGAIAIGVGPGGDESPPAGDRINVSISRIKRSLSGTTPAGDALTHLRRTGAVAFVPAIPFGKAYVPKGQMDACMRLCRFLPLLLIASVCLIPAMDAAIVKKVIYSADFSSDPDWETNNPRTNYWDRDLGEFHYLMRDASGAYLYREVRYTKGSFRLEFDLRQMRTDRDSNLRLGLGNPDMFPDQGSTLYMELSNDRDGRLFWIRSIDQNNCRLQVSSDRNSYNGPTVHFVDNVTYHFVLDYNVDLKTATLQVTRAIDGSPVWKQSVPVMGGYSGMDRIYLSTKNDIENPESSAEGLIDNVVLYSYSTEESPQQTVEETEPLLT
ncbi:MAG TPA: hypothetical protein VE134_05865, partial [Methanomicrobiales archaeon]|nr:hypothetical protein [Methanomicrobiales archaeon]